MKNTSHPDLRLILVSRKGEEQEAAQAIEVWQEAFSDVAPHGIGFCLWLTGDNPSHPEGLDACVHTLHLNRLIDGYQRQPHKHMTWSPWGQKSGPNYQFFAILDAMSKVHDESWVLQLELDTYPLRKVREKDIPWVYAENSDSWIVGCFASKEAEKRLPNSSRGHINGAAFYRIGREDARKFLTETWAIALLSMLHKHPAAPYDTLTSPEMFQRFPESLRGLWSEARNRFHMTTGMINQSTTKTVPQAPQRNPHNEAWFWHGTCLPDQEDTTLQS